MRQEFKALPNEIGRTYKRVTLPRMGDFRFFMCEPGIIEPGNIHGCAAGQNHGLLYVAGGSVKVMIDAPRRAEVDYGSEVRFLRFAIINGKQSHAISSG